jgi:hypothetical protein
MVVQKPILKLTGTIGGQIIYYVLLSFAWMLVGRNATFLDLIAIVVASIVGSISKYHWNGHVRNPICSVP